MTDSSSQRPINISITERDDGATVTADDLGIEVTAANRSEALQKFDTELNDAMKILAEKGFSPPLPSDRDRTMEFPSKEEVDMPPNDSHRSAHSQTEVQPSERKSFSIQRLPIFWQSVLFVLFLLFAINQLLLVPALDRLEQVTSAIVGKDGNIPATHQIGRVVIDHIIELSKASDQITPERREELVKALSKIAVNSKPFFEALQPAYEGLTEQQPPRTSFPASNQRPDPEPGR